MPIYTYSTVRQFRQFFRDVLKHTPFLKLVILLVGMWILFALGLYLAERGMAGSSIGSYGDALYWGVAAFSTAGIATEPISGGAKLLGAIWIVLGSVLFFGAIVATVTVYFMRQLQRPVKQIIDTIEYNLERLDDLSINELDLLKETMDGLIEHVERLKRTQES